MIELTLATTAGGRKKIAVDVDKTPYDVLTENDIDFSVATVHLDGGTLSREELRTSFEDLGITDKAMLIVAVNTKNA